MMNKIEKLEDGSYILTTTDGQTFVCSRWFENKTQKYHVVVPKTARDLCGRTYIRESNFDNTNIYEFETKTEHRTGLTSGGWRTKMTEDERKQVEDAEKLIESIKSICMTREVKKVEKNTEEWYIQEIERLKKKLENTRGQV